MNEDKPTVVGDYNPWQENQNQPGNAGGQGDAESRPTVVDGGPSPFQPTHPEQRSTPTSRFPASTPPPTPPPAPNFPQQPAAPQQPPQRAASSGSSTVIMETVQDEDLPLAWLAVVEGYGAPRGQVFNLQRETGVGRTSGHVVLSGDPAISGQHLKIRLEPSEDDPEKEIFVLYDLASANGTFVGDLESCHDDESRVYRHILSDGDFVRIGQTIMVFKQV